MAADFYFCGMVATAEPIAKKRKPGERGAAIPVLVRLKARALYLHECLPTRTISERTGLPVGTLNAMFRKEGWTAQRRAQEARIVAKQDTQGEAMRSEVLEAINSESVELAAESMKRIRESLTRTDDKAAKDFQAYTAGARNLVSINRAISAPSAGTDQQSQSFNLFFIGAPVAPSKEEPKQVTEVGGNQT